MYFKNEELQSLVANQHNDGRESNQWWEKKSNKPDKIPILSLSPPKDKITVLLRSSSVHNETVTLLWF